jgi:hypothetical protein
MSPEVASAWNFSASSSPLAFTSSGVLQLDPPQAESVAMLVINNVVLNMFFIMFFPLFLINLFYCFLSSLKQ